MAALHTFPSRGAAVDAVTMRIESALQRRLVKSDKVALVVSGGSTPGPVYATLAHRQLDWHRVQVVLSDERWVPSSSSHSNERLIREKLITSRASYASVIPFYEENAAPKDRALALSDVIESLSLPFACSLLGMGEDGHFASLFPDAKNLAVGLDINGTRNCIDIDTAGSPHPRLSLTLRALCQSDEILLMFFGHEKRKVLERAMAGAGNFPVAKLLTQTQVPVDVYWAE